MMFQLDVPQTISITLDFLDSSSTKSMLTSIL